MAATDQTYRSQRALDVVFGVSCLLMLASIIWMFADDYSREWKKEQRAFRDVEVGMAERAALDKLPDPQRLVDAQLAVSRAENGLNQDKLSEINGKMEALRAPLVKSDNRARTIKADLDSRKSFYDLEVERRGPDSAAAKQYKQDIEDLTKQWTEAQNEVDKNKKEMEKLLREKDEQERVLSQAKKDLKTLEQDMVLQLKNAQEKKWRTNDWFRSLPVLDAFNSPVRINQYTLADLPIDYNFKYVTRFDRCTTCHLGIDRPGYTKAALAALKSEPTNERLKKMKAKIADLEKRAEKSKNEKTARELRETAGALRQQVDELQLTTVELPRERVNEFCSHPRLDLFVDPNSPHPVEKFGCTGCHGGQGSATSFFYASHTPDNAAQKQQWQKDHSWSANHDWEFPMAPMRFVETGCLKCHHEITDLIRDGNKIEAPKLVRGYNLVRELGCFGCHEIPGLKGGVSIGPDLRLEPNPPLDSLTPEERHKATADPLNPPGTLRKVGPSLFRLGEKTHLDWVKRWIRSPRSFRPTTKMPHFFGLSNNNPHTLKGTGQEGFPEAEVDAIAHYLLYESAGYTANLDTEHKRDLLKLAKLFDEVEKGLLNQKKVGRLNADQQKQLLELQVAAKDRKALETRLMEKTPGDPVARKAWRPGYVKAVRELEDRLGLLTKAGGITQSPFLNDLQKRELTAVLERLEVRAKQEEANRGRPESLAERFAKSKGKSTLPDPEKDKDKIQQQAKLGRRLFTERGCLACHSHQAVGKEGLGLIADPASPNPDQPRLKEVKLPAIDREKFYKDEPTFGPNLSMLVEKLGTDETGSTYESKREWLIQWILDPHFHSPRTLMPVTHLTFDEAAAVAAWLLEQPVKETGEDWEKVKVPEADLKALQNLAYANLKKVMSDDEIEQLYKGGFDPKSPRMGDLGEDEQELIEMIADKKHQVSMVGSLRWYVGKRAIGRLGCFGCHNIPGFDHAKPVGTPLNDWGKKDPERIAFEDIDAFVKDHYHIVPSLTDRKGNPVRAGKDGKLPYEQFFFEALEHRTREGFLQQKLLEPRSYDYHRIRDWDDRLKMPQFQFARTKRRPGESAAAFQARRNKEEAEAREAVMTFILGLVAEPIPAKYLSTPTGSRLAEARGRKVLDKYNCSSCHMVRQGTYDFQLTPDVQAKLKEGHELDQGSWASDHFFPDHNAWQSNEPVPEKADHIVLHGVVKENQEDQKKFLFLTEATRFRDGGALQDIRAHGLLEFPGGKALRSAVPAWGGNFGDMLVPYYIDVYFGQLNQQNYKGDEFRENNYARASVPPLLLREGEKVQPNWLFQFLRNPFPMRPIAKLRMPRFNMDREEAMALVNYFAAVARRDNPGIGLTYPYAETPQQEPDYLAARSRAYAEKLKQPKDKDRTEYQKRLDALKKIWTDAKDKGAAKGYKELEEAWAKNAYAIDGYRLVSNRNLCLSCHQVGSLATVQKEGGPPLELAQDRLRSDWVLRWVSNPQRFLTYQTIMPMNFPRPEPGKAPGFQELFVGSSEDQVRAIRDILMNFRQVADLPVNRRLARQASAEGGNK